MKKDWLRNCDFLNIPTSLSYKNEYFYSTSVGAFLTIIFFIIIVILSAYEVFLLYEKTSFSLISNQYTDLSQILDFADTPFLFQLINDKGKVIEEDDKLFEIKAYTMEQTTKVENGTKKKKIINTPLEFGTCDKIYSNESEYFGNFNLSKYICAKPGQNLTSYGLLADMNNGFRGIRIYINRCSKSDCYEESVINKKLHNAKFIVTYLSLSSNIFNLNTNNLQYQVFTKSSTISTSLLKKIFFTFDKGKFDLYNSIIFRNKLSFNYIIGREYSIDVDLDTSATMQNNESTICYISFHYSGNLVETKKEVQNIFSTLSIIGNIFNIILTIFKVINNYYSNKILFVDIFKTVFFALENANNNYKENIHLNNNFKNINNKKNNIKKINLDISDEIGFNNNIINKNNIKTSSKKIIMIPEKKNGSKRKSKLYDIEGNANIKNKMIYFYLFPLWYLRKNKTFKSVYFIKDTICGYFSIEKINELIRFKETLDDNVIKSKNDNNELINIYKYNKNNNNLDNSFLNVKNNSIQINK